MSPEFKEFSSPNELNEKEKSLVKENITRKIDRLTGTINKTLVLLVISFLSLNFGRELKERIESSGSEDKIENVLPNNTAEESQSTQAGPGVKISKNNIENISPEDDSERAKLIKKLRNSVDNTAVDCLLISQSVKDEVERQAMLKNVPEVVVENSVDGFLSGVEKEDIELFFKHCIPQGAGVEKVVYLDEKVEASKAYGYGSESEAAAYVKYPGDEIVIARGMKDCDNAPALLDVLAHEAGHCADYLSNRYLTVDEKLCLQNMLVDRLRQPNHFKSPLEEDIKNKDPKMELTLEVTEYFAEIFSHYIKDKTELPSGDRKIVEYVISRIDPDFDSRHASLVMRLLKEKLGAKWYVAKGINVELTQEKVGEYSSLIARAVSSNNQNSQ